jgi:hypothetical protein
MTNDDFIEYMAKCFEIAHKAYISDQNFGFKNNDLYRGLAVLALQVMLKPNEKMINIYNAHSCDKMESYNAMINYVLKEY